MPMQSFRHDPRVDTLGEKTYLHNPYEGGHIFYHVSSQGEEGCSFEDSRLSFFGLSKSYVEYMFNIDPDEVNEFPMGREKGLYTVCEVRFKNITWANIFDLAHYVEYYDKYDSPILTPEGQRIKDATGFGFESYSYENFDFEKWLRGDDRASFLEKLNDLDLGNFYGYLEDEGDEKIPECRDDDHECISQIMWPPMTLAIDFGIGKDIEVELVRYKVVDAARGHVIYSEELDTLVYKESKVRGRRKNPLIGRKDGYLHPIYPNIEIRDNVWYHGSEKGFIGAEFSPVNTQPNEFGGKGYQATFFTPSLSLAREFAFPWYSDSEDGIIYYVQIRDVKIFDVDVIFVDKNDPKSPLTEEGQVFLDRLSHYIDDAHKTLYNLQPQDWEVFNDGTGDGDRRFAALRSTMIDLGYRGWVETEDGEINLALFYPEEDVEVWNWVGREGEVDVEEDYYEDDED